MIKMFVADNMVGVKKETLCNYSTKYYGTYCIVYYACTT